MVMKRFYAFISLIIIISMLSSCKKENAAPEEFSDSCIFNYNIVDACSFAPIGDDICVSFRSSGEVVLYNELGEKIRALDFGEGVHTNLCLYDNRLYSFTHGVSCPYITVYDLSSDECSSFVLDTAVPSAHTMAVVNGNIYLIYLRDFSDEQQKNVKFDENDNYRYNGETAVAISTTDFSVTDVDISNVISLKKYSDIEILYYAYDDIGGYYFTVYNTETAQFSERVYNNSIGSIFSFAYIDDTENIVWSDFPNRKLTSASMNPSDSETDIMSDVITVYGNDVQYADGKVYVLDNMTGSILSTDYAQALRNNREISFCSSEIYSEVPYGCGYTINTSMLSDDEFALNILAGNSSYDICMMSSGQNFSKNIRDKGAFYPLSDVPMVSEYLDSCFPYLKEAATDKYGQIWMIPIAVDIPYILYHPENCVEKGVVFDENTSWDYLFSKAEELYKVPQLRDKYQLNGYQAEGNILNQYSTFYAASGGRNNYDTALFRSICEMLRKSDIPSSESLHTWVAPISRYNDLDAYYEDYLFELKQYRHSLFEQETFDTLRACEPPDIQDDTPNCAHCIYFCVNMNSDNLDDTLRYISSYCSYMLGRSDTYMFTDKARYPFDGTPLAEDLYGIYSNAVISFELSKEMFWEDYIKYSGNQIDIDELINEVGRKTDMYLNE